MAIVGLILILILLLLLGGMIVGIVLIVTSRGSKDHHEMSCGKCGYAVRGLEMLNCPECGADLREAGIVKPGKPHRRVWGIVLLVVCGLMLLTCMGLPMLGWLFASSAPTQQQAAPMQLQPNPPSQGTATPLSPEALPEEVMEDLQRLDLIDENAKQ